MTTLREKIIEKLPKKKKPYQFRSMWYNEAIEDVHSSVDDIIGVVYTEIGRLYKPYEGEESVKSYNDALDDVSKLLKNS